MSFPQHGKPETASKPSGLRSAAYRIYYCSTYLVVSHELCISCKGPRDARVKVVPGPAIGPPPRPPVIITRPDSVGSRHQRLFVCVFGPTSRDFGRPWEKIAGIRIFDGGYCGNARDIKGLGTRSREGIYGGQRGGISRERRSKGFLRPTESASTIQPLI